MLFFLFVLCIITLSEATFIPVPAGSFSTGGENSYKCPSPSYAPIDGLSQCSLCPPDEVATDDGTDCRSCEPHEIPQLVLQHCGQTFDNIEWFCLDDPSQRLFLDGTRTRMTDLTNVLDGGDNQASCSRFMFNPTQPYTDLDLCFEHDDGKYTTFIQMHQELFHFTTTYVKQHAVLVRRGDGSERIIDSYMWSADGRIEITYRRPPLTTDPEERYVWPNNSYTLPLSVIPKEDSPVNDFPYSREHSLPLGDVSNASNSSFAYRGYFPLYLVNNEIEVSCHWNGVDVEHSEFTIPHGDNLDGECSVSGIRLAGFRNGTYRLIRFGTAADPYWAYLDTADDRVAFGDYCESVSDCTGCYENRCPLSLFDPTNIGVAYPYYSVENGFDIGVYSQGEETRLFDSDLEITYHLMPKKLTHEHGIPYIGNTVSGRFCDTEDPCSRGECINHECPYAVNGWFPVYSGSVVGHRINPFSFTHGAINNEGEVTTASPDRHYYTPGIEYFDACEDNNDCRTYHVCSENHCVSMFEDYASYYGEDAYVKTIVPSTKTPLPIRTYKTKECGTCENGRYAGTTSGGSPQCLDCPAGYFSNDKFECKKCPSGYQSGRGFPLCDECRPGYASSDGVSCTKCRAGKFAASDGSRCITCSYGKYQDEEGSIRCKGCGKDTWVDYKGATRADECDECSEGVVHEGWHENLGCYRCMTNLNVNTSSFVSINDIIVGTPISQSDNRVQSGEAILTYGAYGEMEGQCIIWSNGTSHPPEAQYINMRHQDFTELELVFHKNVVLLEEHWYNSSGKPYDVQGTLPSKYRIAGSGHLLGPFMRVPENLTRHDIKGMEANFINPEVIDHLTHGQPKDCNAYALSGDCKAIENIPSGQTTEYYEQLYKEFGGNEADLTYNL